MFKRSIILLLILLAIIDNYEIMRYTAIELRLYPIIKNNRSMKAST